MSIPPSCTMDLNVFGGKFEVIIRDEMGRNVASGYGDTPSSSMELAFYNYHYNTKVLRKKNKIKVRKYSDGTWLASKNKIYVVDVTLEGAITRLQDKLLTIKNREKEEEPLPFWQIALNKLFGRTNER